MIKRIILVLTLMFASIGVGTERASASTPIVTAPYFGTIGITGRASNGTPVAVNVYDPDGVAHVNWYVNGVWVDNDTVPNGWGSIIPTWTFRKTLVNKMDRPDGQVLSIRVEVRDRLGNVAWSPVSSITWDNPRFNLYATGHDPQYPDAPRVLSATVPADVFSRVNVNNLYVYYGVEGGPMQVYTGSKSIRVPGTESAGYFEIVLDPLPGGIKHNVTYLYQVAVSGGGWSVSPLVHIVKISGGVTIPGIL